MHIDFFAKGTQKVKENFLKYRSHIIIMGLFVFLLHGAKLNSDIIGIDTEDLIHLQEGFYDGWLQSGRYGLVGLKYLLGNVQFNPYFTGAMTLLLFAWAVSVFFMLFDKVGQAVGNEKARFLPWVLGGFLWISHPIMVEQFYFSLQSMEICIGILLTAVALYFTDCITKKMHWTYAVISVLLLIMTFSTYQIFVVLYIFGTVAILLLQALQAVSVGEVKAKQLLKPVVYYCVIFFTAFLLNTLITKLFFGNSSYLSNQIAWTNQSVKDCLINIAGHMVKAFTGYDSVFYHGGLLVLALFTLILLTVFLKKCGVKISVGAVILFFYIAVLFTPFMMTVVLGSSPAIRSQLILPALMGFLGYFSVELVGLYLQNDYKAWGARAVLAGCAGICLVGGIAQAKVTSGLYYTDRCRYEHDAALARELIQRIEQINYGETNLPVIVIGKKEFVGSNACIEGEVIGRSFFAYDTEVEPISFWSTRRVLGFMHNFGTDYSIVPKERVAEAMEYSCYMPGWPYEGFVQEVDGMIIVKLSHYEGESEQ